jgi:glycosyltransferase involved in cell wall biosynthesis
MSELPSPLVSVVVPVHDELAGLPELHRRLREALEQVDGQVEVVYVDDGSGDGSTELIETWATSEPDVVLVRLSRNFGLEVAMSAGLDHARGRWVALMHADLQDPPELIPEMLELAGEQRADVVFARRIGRDESGLKRALATGFYKLMERLARVPYQGQAGDFRLMSRRVVDAVRSMPERRRFLRGMVAWAGFRQVPIEYRRAGRATGRGASYPELYRLAVEALTSFSDVPLNLVTWLGIATALTSAVAAVALLVLALASVVDAGFHVWLLVSVLFLGGVQLISVGIVGRYLARVHAEALERPLYVVDRVVSSRTANLPEPRR